MNQRTESGIKLFAVISLICAVIAGGLEYYNTTNSVQWISFNDVFLRAAKTKKLVYIDFYADWCQPCKQMDKTTFADDTVITLLQNDFLATRVNVDDPVFGQTNVKRYTIDAMPTSMLVDADKLEVKRTVGYMNSQDFIAWLKEKK